MRHPLYSDDPLFTPEQLSFRNTVRKFAGSEIAPGYLERAKSRDYPWDVYRRFGELGILGLPLPVAYGGQGQRDFVAMGLAVEEIAYADFNVAAPPTGAWVAGMMLEQYAQPKIAERWLPTLISGEAIICL